MAGAEGSRTFQASGDAYDDFMGRYARQLAPLFADVAGIGSDTRLLDVGCGPGALTAEALSRGAHVNAVDPSPRFVQDCRARHPDATVEQARAEELPFADATFDTAAAQLVFHFISDPEKAVAEMSRVVRPGGTVAGCVWDLAGGMEMLSAFSDAAEGVGAADDLTLVPSELFDSRGELAGMFTRCGLLDVQQVELTVQCEYAGFDQLWQSYDRGVGPLGVYLAGLDPQDREAVRSALFERLGRPAGPITLTGLAHAARGMTAT